jgi:hypothetical protein
VDPALPTLGRVGRAGRKAGEGADLVPGDFDHNSADAAARQQAVEEQVPVVAEGAGGQAEGGGHVEGPAPVDLRRGRGGEAEGGGGSTGPDLGRRGLDVQVVAARSMPKQSDEAAPWPGGSPAAAAAGPRALTARPTTRC